MKILVCLKQVPDSTVRVQVAPGGKSIVSDGVTWSISPYDEYALEVAFEHKDADPATVVTAVTLGPARSRDALRHALAMGCDEATLVTGADAEALGSLATARALAKVVAEQAPDLVLCGKQASDDDSGLVGPAIAEARGWSHLAMVTKVAPSANGLEVTREVDGGHEVWSTKGPVVLTVHKSDKEPRYPTLPGIVKAKKKQIPEVDLAGLLDAGDAALPRAEIVRMEPPPSRGAGKIMKDGDMDAIATELARLLRDEAKVL